MNKVDLRGLPSKPQPNDFLAQQLSGRRVLLIKSIQTKDVVLKDYFDVIIVSNVNQLSFVSEPDVFLHVSPQLDDSFIIEWAPIFQLTDTLLCINHHAVDDMRKYRWHPGNYVVSFIDKLKDMPEIISNIKDLFVLSDEALTLPDGVDTLLTSFTQKTGKFQLPINIRSKNRPLLMNSWSQL